MDREIKTNKYLMVEKGNALLITTVILLIMVVMMGHWLTMGNISYETMKLERYSSQTYDLAKTSAEEYVKLIQRSLAAQLPSLIREIRTDQAKSDLTSKIYKEEVYSDWLQVYQIEDFKELIVEKIYYFLETNFINETIKYQIQSDSPEVNSWTDIQIRGNTDKTYKEKLKSKHQFLVQAEAITRPLGTSLLPEIYDRQMIEVLIQIELPMEIINEGLIDIRGIGLTIKSLKKVKKE